MNGPFYIGTKLPKGLNSVNNQAIKVCESLPLNSKGLPESIVGPPI
ncbi:hypothetical protein [Paenibacillus polymyxa]|nr:hypothetical protein [Paenibacillus polymyxa]